jgi:hypothetical protein
VMVQTSSRTGVPSGGDGGDIKAGLRAIWWWWWRHQRRRKYHPAVMIATTLVGRINRRWCRYQCSWSVFHPAVMRAASPPSLNYITVGVGTVIIIQIVFDLHRHQHIYTETMYPNIHHHRDINA